ncbi:hypothetical protein G6N82_09015 [Altererythrobacter sp. BO-6]|uniref:hypothetical protein n=1 Tax=Altererythrobacter sp. BO-6 TaxID=2604537 RepID=UPI0013E1F9E5|nr:hypothetical protein [Altererythrobacter sp. BO-6]QIG54266.1 hypothetical protein G6N82_09015 [Altererythrobacter sp. BO-6]
MSLTARYYVIGVSIFIGTLIFGLLELTPALHFFLGVFSIWYLGKACSVKDGSNSVIVLYLIFSGLYVFAAYSEVAFLGNRLNFDTTLMANLANMGLLFLVAVTSGYLVCRKNTSMSGRVHHVSGEMVSAAIYTCVVLFVTSTLLTISLYGTEVGAISRGELYSNYSSTLTLLRGILAIGFGVAAALLVSHEKRIGQGRRGHRTLLFATLSAYIIIDLLILGDRRLPLMAILGVAVVMLPKSFTWKQICAAIIIAFALFIYGFVRNTPPSQWLDTITSGDILLVFSPASTEFGGLATIGQAIGNFDYPLSGFPTYLDGVPQLFPQALIDDRPLSPTEWFVQNYYPELAAIGASFAFNQVIEARLNLGLLGVAFVGVITGIGISLLSRLRYCGAAIGAPLCLQVFCFSMRMDLVSILRTSIIAGLGAALVLMVATLARRGT